MTRIADVVEREVRRLPFVEAALGDGLFNMSALARQLQPRIRRVIGRPVSDSAIMMALRRLEPRVTRRLVGPRHAAAPVTELTVRSDLMEFAFLSSPTIRTKQGRLLARLGRFQDAFVTFTQGVSQAMLIVNDRFERQVEECFDGEHRVATVKGLSAIVLRLAPSVVRTPGAYYRILKQLAWDHVNVIDVVSTYTEFTIVIEDRQVDVAFAALRAIA
ncbi:MAG: aspartate kinase [Gemmatimonadetes bacterium]|nr:aspartate kinase [Gemmatimonadota bacterium]